MTISIDNNLRLELLDRKHAFMLFDAVDRSREHLATFLPWVSRMGKPEDFETYVESCIQLQQQNKEASFVMIDRDIVVGRIGIHYINPFNRAGAIGYWISAAASGNGIVTRSCTAVTDYGFRVLGLHRIEIKAAVHNLKSRAIPEKLGFTREGLLRQAELVNGTYFDLVLYAMVSHEWKG